MRWLRLGKRKTAAAAAAAEEPGLDDWVRAYQVASYHDAMRVRIALEAAGIPFRIEGEHVARAIGLGAEAPNPWILVRKRDLGEARELIAES